MVSYCLSDITYGIDDGYSDGFYVVTISGTLKGGLAPYLTSVQGGQAAWLDVKISYHNDVFSCKVNNQSKVSNDGLTITNYMIDCYRQHLQDDTQAQADQEEQQTIEANRFSDLSVDQQKQCIGWGASADDTMILALSACGSSAPADSEPFSAAGGGTSDLSVASWEDVLAQAKDTTVTFYGWGGDENRNNWLNSTVADFVKEHYDITLDVVGMDIDDILSKLSGEKQAGAKTGSIDMSGFIGTRNKEVYFTLLNLPAKTQLA